MVEGAPIEAAQRSIQDRVSGEGGALARLGPRAMVAVLAGAALWPVAAPLLGTGAAVGVAGGVLGLLSGPGQAFMTDFLERMRRSGRPPPEAELRGELDRALEDAMRSAGLREDIGHLLRQVDGVNVALTAAADETRSALAAGLSELGAQWAEFGWILADVQARQYEALALGRQQLDLQREAVVKLNRLLAERERRRAPQRAPPRDRRRRPRGVPAPYKGLRRYEAEDAALFFGRDALRAELLARVAESRILALVGDSGSGKSSLLRAGLVRAIWDGVLPGGADWRVVVLAPGARPLDELAARVSALCEMTPGALLGDLRADPRTLALAARRAVAGAPSGSRLLVVVDQLEELFTLGVDETTRRAFLDALLAARRDETGALTVVVAIRGDFLGRLAEHTGLPEALRDNKILVGPLADDDLALAIEGPAAYAGLTVEPELVELVLAEARDARGALPLVSHALLETFDRGSGRVLTVRDYVDAGGLRGALAQSADEVLDRMAPGQREIARSILLRLTSLGESTENTRRRATLGELVGDPARAVAVEAVLDTLVRARLVTSGEGGVEIAHEALIRHWPTLRSWLDDDRDALLLHRRLTLAAQYWEAVGRDSGALYRGAPLAAAVEWLTDHGDAANRLEREFVETARRAERDELDEARRRTRRLTALAGALAALLLVAATTTALALRESDRADQQRAAAQRAVRVADSRRLAATAVAGLRSSVDVPTLLALHAYLQAPTAEARSALVSVLENAPHLRATFRDSDRQPVPHIRAAPDGTVMSVGWDGLLRFFDARTLRPTEDPLPVGQTPQGFDVSPDGRWIAVAAEQRIRVWERRPGHQPRLRGDRPAWHVLSLAIGGDPPLVAVGREDGSVRLYDVPALTPAGGTPRRPGRAVSAVALLGSTVAFGGQGSAQVWLWRRGESRATGSANGAGVVTSVDATPDGTRIAAVGSGGLIVHDEETGGLLRRSAPTGTMFTGVAISDDGLKVATGADDGTVTLFRADDLTPEGAVLRAHEQAVAGLAFVSHGEGVVSGSDDGTVRLWAVGPVAGAATAQAPGLASGRVAALSPEGSAVAVGSDGLWYSDAAGRRLPAGPVASTATPVTAVAVAGDGARAAAAEGDGRVIVWDARAHERVGRPLRGPPQPVIAFDRRGDALAIGALRGSGPRIWDLGSGAKVRLPAAGGGVGSLAFSGDGALLAFGGYDGATRLWDVRARRTRGLLMRGGGDVVRALAFSDDAAMLAAGAGQAVTLWDVRTGRRIGSPLAATAPVEAMAFSADGHTLAIATGNSVRLWDVPRRRPLGQPLRGHDADVDAVAFAADGALVSADHTGGVVRWDPLLASENPGHWRARLCRAINSDLTIAQWGDLASETAYEPTCATARAARP